MKLLLYCSLWLAATGSGHQQSQTEPATLILYREKEFNLGRSKAYTFVVNEKDQIELLPNRYVRLSVIPGQVKIRFDTDYYSTGKTIFVSTQPGRTHYVKVAVDMDFVQSSMLMAPVAAAEAQRELRRMKPLPRPIK